MDKSREQFEAAIKQKYGDLIDQGVCKNGDGEYMAWDMQVAWWAWQASRAAVEIDAPAEPFYPMPINSCPTDHYHYGRESVISKVRAAGLKVKGE
ncbi:hypothetical protein QLY72_07275 [Cronobacter malonaticus]|uniref:hypothetical protein n=1 Tax=Cronobacter malonaticus TaxID=413503 RepID=UPI0024AF90BB|nr:hypothetical protein [Cronobacter malonaticus]MDI7592240.1 hypothetical protein [Cronobacter malonaticus]